MRAPYVAHYFTPTFHKIILIMVQRKPAWDPTIFPIQSATHYPTAGTSRLRNRPYRFGAWGWVLTMMSSEVNYKILQTTSPIKVHIHIVKLYVTET